MTSTPEVTKQYVNLDDFLKTHRPDIWKLECAKSNTGKGMMTRTLNALCVWTGNETPATRLYEYQFLKYAFKVD